MGRKWDRGRAGAGRELLLGFGAYALYLAVRRAVLRRDGRARACANAERIARAERRLGLAVEPALQRAFLRRPGLVKGLNVGYAIFNVTLTLGWLVLLYRRQDAGYGRFRRACLLAHLGAQPVFLLLPTAPPRAVEGFVDTFSEVSGVDIENPRLVRLYNPVAAMPSLHVAFAIVTGGEMAARAGSPVPRALARGYAPFVALVVLGTGNHFVLDVAAGAALGTAARRFAGSS